jgi:hypothetical protein
MARRKNESGKRQKWIRHEKAAPKQNRGDGEALHGIPRAANDRPDRMVPVSAEESQLQNTTEDVDEREARRAREQARKRDGSASRQSSREP